MNLLVFKSHKRVAMVARRRVKLLYGDDDLLFGSAALANSFSTEAAALHLPESAVAAVSLLPDIKTAAGATLKLRRRTLLSALPTAPII